MTTEGKISEYGREKSELVKQDGKWLIKSRVVLTEGGMPASLLEYYPKKQLGKGSGPRVIDSRILIRKQTCPERWTCIA